ncbi:hypothetical protein ACQPYH_28795 [Kribbella sp. CA-245084]|uniref:hypothetical protein n=1 Tax=Kribbella sp. CA-245084 TaxID=3239940 RepID=UPI003D92B5B8
MKVSDGWMPIADLVRTAEAVIVAREAEEPNVWAMTAFSRFRVVELLSVEPMALYGRDLDLDPVVLLEEAATAVEQLVVPVERVVWRLSLAAALRDAIADVRMVCGACDV